MEIRVYPEFCEPVLLKTGVEIYANTVDGFSRMYLYYNGVQKRSYDKVFACSKCNPAEDFIVPEVFEKDDVAISIICCRDVGEEETLVPITKQLIDSKMTTKILAISADMGIQWFPGSKLSDSRLHGFHVALSNLDSTGCESFVSNPFGNKFKEKRVTINERHSLEVCEG